MKIIINADGLLENEELTLVVNTAPKSGNQSRVEVKQPLISSDDASIIAKKMSDKLMKKELIPREGQA